MVKDTFSRHENYRAILVDPATWHRTIGIISCKILRERHEYNPLWQRVLDFLAGSDFRDLVAKEGWHLAVTGGTFECIPSYIKELPEYQNRMHCLAPSALGVIQLASLAVYKRLVAVAFFNHMEDLYADSPQNLCLRRICNEVSVPLLEDICSIDYVFRNPDWEHRRDPAGDNLEHDRQVREYYGTKPCQDSVLGASDFVGRNRDRQNETIAVVAHNEKKMSMVDFCVRNASKILSYKRIISTGTTGRYLTSIMEAHLGERCSPGEAALWDWQEGEDLGRFLRRKIQPFESGPDGGDVQVSAKVIDGTCHRVLFFQDPHSAHAHQFDIRLMEKAVQDPYTAALFATCEATAKIIA